MKLEPDIKKDTDINSEEKQYEIMCDFMDSITESMNPTTKEFISKEG